MILIFEFILKLVHWIIFIFFSYCLLLGHNDKPDVCQGTMAWLAFIPVIHSSLSLLSLVYFGFKTLQSFLTLVTGNFQTFFALATAEVICLALARKLLGKNVKNGCLIFFFDLECKM